MHLSAISTAILAMASTAYSHMVMTKPSPGGNPSTSPLLPDGSNFPCNVASYTPGPINEWIVGENSSFLWAGGAIHFGGSCQLALTTDKQPTKDSVYKVIYSIEGGCPGFNSSTGPVEFPFTVPKEVPNGEFTATGVWWNRVGNREMYGNCASIKVSGGSDDKSAFEKLPDMAIANINVGKGASCKTTEGYDYIFENPGEYKTRIESEKMMPLCGGDVVGGAPGTPPSTPEGPDGNNGKYTPPASQPTAAPQHPAAPQGPQSANNSAPDAVTSTIRTLITVTASPNAPEKTPAAQPSQSPADQGRGNISEGGSCSPDGALVCNGPTQFGLCNYGKVIFQSVAAGTKCQNGAIVGIGKRDYMHRAQRAHIYKHRAQRPRIGH